MRVEQGGRTDRVMVTDTDSGGSSGIRVSWDTPQGARLFRAIPQPVMDVNVSVGCELVIREEIGLDP